MHKKLYMKRDKLRVDIKESSAKRCENFDIRLKSSKFCGRFQIFKDILTLNILHLNIFAKHFKNFPKFQEGNSGFQGGVPPPLNAL